MRQTETQRCALIKVVRPVPAPRRGRSGLPAVRCPRGARLTLPRKLKRLIMAPFGNPRNAGICSLTHRRAAGV